MTCLVPNCQHPQSRGNLCRWHRKEAQLWRDDPELGFARFCTGCDEWLPVNPEPDADGNPVVFFYKGEWRCRVCNLDAHSERVRRKVA